MVEDDRFGSHSSLDTFPCREARLGIGPQLDHHAFNKIKPKIPGRREDVA